MIVFLVVGIMEVRAAFFNLSYYINYTNKLWIFQNGASELDEAFHLVYCLQSDVDISPLALTGMKQSGLCVLKDSRFDFHSTDTFATIDEKLRIIFPRLFDWLSETELDDMTTSSWLICMKPPYTRRSLVVYSDD
jgi:hypothetical protein